MITQLSFNYTLWLNLVFGALAAWFVYLNWRNPITIAILTTDSRVATSFTLVT